MSARYWIAKHIPNVFRNEPRNIGIIVESNGRLFSQFKGEKEDGTLDGRQLREFASADAYRQWIEFWRSEIAEGSVEYITSYKSPNFILEGGGELKGCQGDSVVQIGSFLFTSLVSDGGIREAYGWDDEVETSATVLEKDVSAEFERFNLLSERGDKIVRNPIERRKPVTGAKVIHQPDFIQKNSHLSVFETIDFTQRDTKRIRDRAGWASYMFSDIKEVNIDCQSFAIVRLKESASNDALNYARSMLQGEAEIVNWSDDQSRGAFLAHRSRVADTI